MNNIVNRVQLDQLINDTYIYAVIVFVVAIAFAFIVSNLIAWQGGEDRSYIKRRIVYIIIGVVSVLGFWLYNDQVVVESIRGAGFQNMFKACNAKCLGITITGYLVVGVILMFCFRHSKFGSILGKEKNK